VPEKPTEEVLSEEKDAFLIAIDGTLYVVDVEALKRLGRLGAMSEGSYIDWSVPDYFKTDLKHQRAEIIHVKRNVPSSNPTMGGIGMIAEIVSGRKTIETTPVAGVASGVEQPVIDEMIAKATEVIGSRDEAMRWLGTPVRALNFATPISILGTKDGVGRVNDVLGQMEYGIW
jgi:hypothetical protein